MEGFVVMNILLCISICLCWKDPKNRNQFIAQEGWHTFQSPNYPSNYPNNYEDVYYFNPRESNHVVCFQPVAFDLENSVNCSNDYLSYQSSMLEQPVGKWCGTTMPSFCSEGIHSYIRFRSNNNVTGSGFQIKYRMESLDKGVPVGVIVGIVVAVFVILVVIAGVYLHRRWGKESRAPISSSAASSPPAHGYDNTETEKRYQDPPPSYETLAPETKE